MGDYLPSKRTGEVFIRNFDQGVVETLGGTVRHLPGNIPGGTRHGYWIDILGATPMTVPIIFGKPEQIYEGKIYPSIVVSRNPPEPALQRWHSEGLLEYRAGVSGTEYEAGGVTGYGQVELKDQAWPFDIIYDISCYARYEHEAIPMLKRILRVFQPYSKIDLLDSLGEKRSYDAFVEGGPLDMSEIADVADRVKAYMVSVRVEGELDLRDAETFDTVSGVVNTLGKM